MVEKEGKREREKNDIVIYIMLNLYISSTSQTPREENKVTDIVWGGGGMVPWLSNNYLQGVIC